MEALAALLCLHNELVQEADFPVRWNVDVFV